MLNDVNMLNQSSTVNLFFILKFREVLLRFLHSGSYSYGFDRTMPPRTFGHFEIENKYSEVQQIML